MDGSILIGYDGSDDAQQAIRTAGALLAPRRAVVAYVCDPLAGQLLSGEGEVLPRSVANEVRELEGSESAAAEALAGRGAELARDVGFEAGAVVAHGHPKAWPVLLALAGDHDAAAVVVGSRGLGGVASALLGSVSGGVLDHAQLPVLVVPSREHEQAGPVLIGYDGSAHSDAAVESAAALLRGREAVVATVWSSYAAVAPAGAIGMPAPMAAKAVAELDATRRTAAEQTARHGAELASRDGLEARADTPCGGAAVWRKLLEVADERDAAAIAVGSRGRSGLGAALLGSVSRALIHHARRPVLVVRRRKR